MIIIYDSDIWSNIWYKYVILIYDSNIWYRYMTVDIWCTYMSMSIYDSHIWTHIYDRHMISDIWCQYMTPIYEFICLKYSYMSQIYDHMYVMYMILIYDFIKSSYTVFPCDESVCNGSHTHITVSFCRQTFIVLHICILNSKMTVVIQVIFGYRQLTSHRPSHVLPVLNITD